MPIPLRLIPVTQHVTLVEGSSRVEFRLEMDNRAENFRLQTAFPIPATGIGAAHTPFSVSPRTPIAAGTVPNALADRQPGRNSAPQPMQYFARFDLQDGGALTVMNRGLYEYTWEVRGQPCITLMRAVGLICDGLDSHDASGGQCPGRHVFEYAIRVDPDAGEADAVRDAFAYNLGPLAMQVFHEPRRVAVGIEFTNPHWMPAAVKPRENGAGFVVRFWNASPATQDGEVRVGIPFLRVSQARMDETELAAIGADGAVALAVGPFEIVTLVFEP